MIITTLTIGIGVVSSILALCYIRRRNSLPYNEVEICIPKRKLVTRMLTVPTHLENCQIELETGHIPTLPLEQPNPHDIRLWGLGFGLFMQKGYLSITADRTPMPAIRLIAHVQKGKRKESYLIHSFLIGRVPVGTTVPIRYSWRLYWDFHNYLVCELKADEHTYAVRTDLIKPTNIAWFLWPMQITKLAHDIYYHLRRTY